jgi:hypothetical protein
LMSFLSALSDTRMSGTLAWIRGTAFGVIGV